MTYTAAHKNTLLIFPLFLKSETW